MTLLPILNEERSRQAKLDIAKPKAKRVKANYLGTANFKGHKENEERQCNRHVISKATYM